MPHSVTDNSSGSDIDWEAFDNAFANTTNPISLFRDTLKQAREILKTRFENNDPADLLVHHHAKTVDQLLIRAWQYFIGADENKISLIAVGGYGRGELHPASVIDLLILLKSNQH